MSRNTNRSFRAAGSVAVAIFTAGIGLSGGCQNDETASNPESAAGFRYDLVCDSSDTDQKSSLVCIRVDSVNGD